MFSTWIYIYAVKTFQKISCMYLERFNYQYTIKLIFRPNEDLNSYFFLKTDVQFSYKYQEQSNKYSWNKTNLLWTIGSPRKGLSAATESSETGDNKSRHEAYPVEDSNAKLVLSGGEGYVDFRIGLFPSIHVLVLIKVLIQKNNAVICILDCLF